MEKQICEKLKFFIDHYQEKQEDKEFIRKAFNDIESAITEAGYVNEGYKIKSNLFGGEPTNVPLIGILKESHIKRHTQLNRIFVAYMLPKIGDTIYLVLIQGSKANENGLRERLEGYARTIHDRINQGRINPRGFRTERLVLEGRLTASTDLYIPATLLYREYQKESLPSEEVLRDDLEKMLSVYNDCIKECSDLFSDNAVGTHSTRTEETTMRNDTIEMIKAYIEAKGFHYDGDLIENFYLCLKTKPFVILAGISGTGKTRLVRLFAEAIGAEYKLVPVRPDWSDSSDLLGHLNLDGKFVRGAVIDFIKDASEHTHTGKPYFLCLDEMNLARVEYYLSDILSVIETRDRKDSEIKTDILLNDDYFGKDEEAREAYGNLYLPENLYIIGTVNMDETTFPFSKKVLDRANTIEFSDVTLNELPDESAGLPRPLEAIPDGFLKSSYVHMKDCISDENRNTVKRICDKLENFNEILKSANAHVGYRVRDEIVFYSLYGVDAVGLDENHALDNVILQKILPRIQGSSAKIKEMLEELERQFENEYPKSAEKIAFMLERLEEDGFTTYWL